MEITKGSGNVFANLELPNPEERLAKARIAYRIEQLIAEAGLAQADAAQRMGLTHPTGGVLDFLNSLPPGPRSAATFEEIERNFQQERDAWDR